MPDGFRDHLGQEAYQHYTSIHSMMCMCHQQGYDRVAPPLIEYEEGLNLGPGGLENLPPMFRLMDPETQKLMAIRSDMTPQVSRLAMTRLASAPRPLRLSYAGNVVRFKGSAIRPSRHYTQVGAELIGCASPEAQAEVILLAVDLLYQQGVSGISVDLTLPNLARDLIETSSLALSLQSRMLSQLETKDKASLAQAGPMGQILARLVSLSGPVKTALPALQKLPLAANNSLLVEQLARLIDLIAASRPDLTITLDATERRGFGHISGIGFAFFGREARSELGRGGCYELTGEAGDKESATGFSLYMDRVADCLPKTAMPERVYITDMKLAEVFADKLPKKVQFIKHLSRYDQDDLAILAKDQRCSWILTKAGLIPVI